MHLAQHALGVVAVLAVWAAMQSCCHVHVSSAKLHPASRRGVMLVRMQSMLCLTWHTRLVFELCACCNFTCRCAEPCDRPRDTWHQLDAV
jgi:hypothetical protein